MKPVCGPVLQHIDPACQADDVSLAVGLLYYFPAKYENGGSTVYYNKFLCMMKGFSSWTACYAKSRIGVW